MSEDEKFLVASCAELRLMAAKLRKLNPIGKSVVAAETVYGLELAAEGFDVMLDTHKQKRATKRTGVFRAAANTRRVLPVPSRS